MMKKWGVAIVALVAGAAPAHAVTFNLINLGGAEVGTQARSGFEAATKYWSSVLKDDFTVNLEIGFSKLPPNVLGSTRSSSADILVEDIYGGLAADSRTGVDARAVINLKPLSASSIGPFGAVTAITSGELSPGVGIDTTTTRLDNDGSYNNTLLSTNTANAKALGFTSDAYGDPFGAVDGQVIFSNEFAFDFSPTSGIHAGQSDFIGVAVHEIGHALGFVSGVDLYDVYGGPNSPVCASGGRTCSDLLVSGRFGSTTFDDFSILSPLDLFRYSNAGLDWSVGTAARFSIDGGAALFGASGFSTGDYNGDGWQASHWKAPQIANGNFSCRLPKLGIMNPYLCGGQGGIVTALDLAAFDAIGYDVNVDVLANPLYRSTTADIARLSGFVPEPGSWAMMIAGFGLTGAAMRRRRSVPAAA